MLIRDDIEQESFSSSILVWASALAIVAVILTVFYVL
jgi:hypothetical protein